MREGFDPRGIPVTDDDGRSRIAPPLSEPFVEETFPDSTYDAIEAFGSPRLGPDAGDDEDDDDDDGELEQGDEGADDDVAFGEGADDGPTHIFDVLERAAGDIRLRLDTAEPGDRGSAGSRTGGGRARSFDEGASRFASTNLGTASGAVSDATEGRSPTRTVGRPEPDVSLIITPVSVSSLKGGSVSIVMHAAFAQADEAFRIHKLCDTSCRIDIYQEDE